MAERITDEGVDRLRSRIGIARSHSAPPHYQTPNEDAFRHVAMACGDDNPLWCNPDYGVTTRWGGPIASPQLVGGDTLIGEDEITRLPDNQKELMKGDPLGGVHAFIQGVSENGGTHCIRVHAWFDATLSLESTTRSVSLQDAQFTSGLAKFSLSPEVQCFLASTAS